MGVILHDSGAVILAEPSSSLSGAPAAGSMAFTGIAPTASVAAALRIVVPTIAVIFTESTPLVAAENSQTVAVGDGSVAFTGIVPTVTAAAARVSFPPTGGFVFTSYTPQFSTGARVYVSPDTIIFTGVAPTVMVVSSADPQRLTQEPVGSFYTEEAA